MDKKLLERVKEITLTDYKEEEFDSEIYESMIEGLVYECDRLNEIIRHMENDIESNYVAIPYNEQVEIYDSDFI